MVDEIRKVIQEKVQPYLMAHEGDLQVVSYNDGICRVRFLGKCAGCPAAEITMEDVIRREVIQALPEVKDVVLIDDTSQDMLDFARHLLRQGRKDTNE